MAFTTDTSTAYGRIRLLTTDRDPDNVIYQDSDLDGFLALEDNNVKRASALALESIAVDQVLVLKVMTTLGLTTNGAAVASALLNRAKMLRDTALFDEAQSGDLWDSAEFVITDFQAQERLVNEVLRSNS